MFIKLLKIGLLLILLGYGLAINTYLAIYLACEDCVLWVAQANHVAHWITLSNVLILPLVLLVPGRRWVLIWLLPGVIAFVSWYGVHFIPKSDPAVEGQTPFRVMTFNTLGYFADHEETVRIITEIDPDILGVQELQETLEAMLQAHYPYYAATLEMHGHRVGLFSRFPIVEFYGDMPLKALLDIDGQLVVVYVHHPPQPFFRLGRVYNDQRSEQVYADFMTMLDQETLPVLVLCDCNTTPRTHQYAQMDQRLDDAFKVQGWGFGLTHGGNYRLHSVATIRIDYLWYREPLLPVHVEVGQERGSSDHLPVWGDFVLQR